MTVKKYICGWLASRWPSLSESASAPNPKDAIGLAKVPLRLIPPVALAEEAGALANGAQKYGPFNWRQHPVLATVYYEAALRHLHKWFDGEDRDADSGLSHWAHVRACAAILLDAHHNGNLIDDRPPPGAFAALCDRPAAAPESPTCPEDAS